MKRYFFRDVARNLRSHAKLRYMIAVVRKLGGVDERECPLCGYQGLFHACDHPPRYDCQCPRCGSQERQRLVALLLQGRPELGPGRVIHFAPAGEAGIERLLRQRASSYATADLQADGCDLRLDLEALELEDSSVDLFVLNHVLEHVDDLRALSELFRCTAPGGTVLITTPIVEAWPNTWEDSAIDSDAARLKYFGKHDHLRLYGSDLRDRIKAAGFALGQFTGSGEDVVRYGLLHGESVFIARRPL